MAVLEKAGHQILAPISVNIALHIGTLAATVAYFRRQLWDLLWKDRRTLSLVILATIPAVVIGVASAKAGSQYLGKPMDSSFWSSWNWGTTFGGTAACNWAAAVPSGCGGQKH